MIRGASRLIRGKRPVVCLFDATTHELGGLLVRSNRRRYEPFGLAIDKRYAFAMGARPVLYMPWREARMILAEEEWWRVAAIDLERKPPIDWSFEREWRVAGDLPLPAAWSGGAGRELARRRRSVRPLRRPSAVCGRDSDSTTCSGFALMCR